MFSLAGRVAVVTGASRGLGELAATVFAEAGANLVLIGRDQTRLDAVAADLTARFGIAALPLVADVTDSAALKLAADAVEARFGRVDILVNNAGIATQTSLIETSDADWERVIDTNLNGPWRVVRAFAPMMIAHHHGRIINIGSLMADRAAVNRASYSAAKAGLVHLGRAMAVELGPFGITVNAIGPSAIKTDINRAQMEGPEKAAYDQFLVRVPLGRWGNPEDLAGTLLYFASDASAYVTGQSIYVDGGLMVT